MSQPSLGNLNHVDKVWHLRQAELSSGLSDRDLFAIAEEYVPTLKQALLG